MERSPGKLFRSTAAPVSSAVPKEKSFDQGSPAWASRSNAKNFRTAPKNKTFDRGGLVWPPRSNATDGRERKETFLSVVIVVFVVAVIVVVFTPNPIPD